jgi:hypothetical protein
MKIPSTSAITKLIDTMQAKPVGAILLIAFVFVMCAAVALVVVVSKFTGH